MSAEGRSIDEWVKQVGIARPTYYTLPDGFRPRAVKVGSRVIITESPAEWLDRVAVAGGVPSHAALPEDVRGNMTGSTQERLRYWATQVNRWNTGNYGSRVRDDLVMAANELDDLSFLYDANQKLSIGG